MNKLLLLTGALTALLALGCTEDRFSQVVDIDLPEHESRPVLSLNIVGGDTVAWPRVSYSVGILEDDPTDRPATLQLFREGEPVLTLNTSTGDIPREGVALPVALPDEPADYEVVVQVDGIGTARAEQSLPPRPTAELISYDPEGAIDIDGFRVAEAVVRITDPGEQRNYYGFRVIDPGQSCTPDTCIFTYRESYSRYVTSPDPIVRPAGYQGAVVSDESFDGTSYDVRLRFDNFGASRKGLEIWSMTEDGYRFSLSLEAYELAQDNPFAEPVNVHSNLEDGYGIFMASSRVRYDLEE